jgi:V8-like Glu-specific endopeptidase
MFSFLIVGLLALTFVGSLLSLAPAGASAQRSERQDPPLVEPLERDDPRAALSPEWFSAEQMPFPVFAVAGAADGNPLAAAEASFDNRAGKEAFGEKPSAPAKLDDLALSKASELFPGNLGTNANNDTLDEQINERLDMAQRAGQPNTVQGPDDRIRISPTTSYPWRAMTKLRMTFPSGRQFICSGALVASKYTLTAGHCVFSHTEGGWARSIEVIPGLDGTYKPYGSAYAVWMRSYVGWTQNQDSNYDFALITLDRTIGNSTGWFGYASYSTVNGLTANLGGYPGDRDSGLRLYYHYGTINSSTTNRVFYTIDTAGGQSGSGVYRINNGSRYIFAVHTNGGSSSNSGTRITSQRFNDLSAWIATGQ